MLKYIIRDINNNVTIMKRPVRVMLTSSENAPADRISAAFAVRGEVPVLYSIEVINSGERVFFGYVDEQSERRDKNGVLLTVSARSLAAVLLDNEARPQVYCCPSMELLMKRHFAPLGFEKFRGGNKSFNGQITVSKGMSEWSLLEAFCRFMPGVEPRIDKYGVIDISGEDTGEALYLSCDCIMSKRRELRNSAFISEIMARTNISGGYDMPIRNKKAQSLGIKRRRYLDLADKSRRNVSDAKKIAESSCRAYERLILECGGCFLCQAGCGLKIEGDRKKYRITEIIYSFGLSGEKTRIEAEVVCDEDI